MVISFSKFISPLARVIKEVISGEKTPEGCIFTVHSTVFIMIVSLLQHQLSICHHGRNMSPVFKKSNMDSISW